MKLILSYLVPTTAATLTSLNWGDIVTTFSYQPGAVICGLISWGLVIVYITVSLATGHQQRPIPVPVRQANRINLSD